jgi:hypothetical protein
VEPEVLSSRQIRVRFADLSPQQDPFLRYEVLVLDVDARNVARVPSQALTTIFVDTGASINTISRVHKEELEAQGITTRLISSPRPLALELVGGRQLRVSGDQVQFDMKVATTLGVQYHTESFYILEHDSEHLTMGVNFHNKVVVH